MAIVNCGIDPLKVLDYTFYEIQLVSDGITNKWLEKREHLAWVIAHNYTAVGAKNIKVTDIFDREKALKEMSGAEDNEREFMPYELPFLSKEERGKLLKEELVKRLKAQAEKKNV